jgi:hypothetical protein
MDKVQNLSNNRICPEMDSTPFPVWAEARKVSTDYIWRHQTKQQQQQQQQNRYQRTKGLECPSEL